MPLKITHVEIEVTGPLPQDLARLKLWANPEGSHIQLDAAFRYHRDPPVWSAVCKKEVDYSWDADLAISGHRMSCNYHPESHVQAIRPFLIERGFKLDSNDLAALNAALYSLHGRSADLVIDRL